MILALIMIFHAFLACSALATAALAPKSQWVRWYSRSETMQRDAERSLRQVPIGVSSNITREDCDPYNIPSARWRSARSLVCRGSRQGFSVNETSHIFAEDQKKHMWLWYGAQGPKRP